MSPENHKFGTLPKELVASLLADKLTSPRSKEAFLDSLVNQGYPPDIIAAFAKVPREKFMPEGIPQEYTYAARPWPLSDQPEDSSISEPDIVARMTRLLELEPGNKVLEIGTATGYQAAIISHLVGPQGLIISCEIDPELTDLASKNLALLNLANIILVTADASAGLADQAPFDRIIVTCSLPPFSPEDQILFRQLAPGGKLVAPLGGFVDPRFCRLITVNKDRRGELTVQIENGFVRFVPMKGEFDWDLLTRDLWLKALQTFFRDLHSNFEPLTALLGLENLPLTESD